MTSADAKASVFQSKKRLRVVIRDYFDEDEFDIGDILAQLDPSEKDEVDIVNAVKNSGDKVPVPEVEIVEGARTAGHRSGSYFEAAHRCFNYDSDFFEPIKYYADEVDFAFIEKFNDEHKFLHMRSRDLEKVFCVCEEIVKDSLNEPPTLSQVMLSLGDDAPPAAICEAIFEHWEGREKQVGSIVRWLEFPPDHYSLRHDAIANLKAVGKNRKNTKGGESLKLLQRLVEISRERIKAEESLEQQQIKQREDEQFVRRKEREMKEKLSECEAVTTMVLQPPAKKHPNVHPGPPEEDRTHATVPQPASGPSFLKWCMGSNHA